MKQYRLAKLSLAAAALATVSACATDPNTGRKRISRTAIGAGIGAVGGLLVGGLVGGSGAKIIGAGIGGVAGGAIGSGEDRQGARRERTEGAGTEVEQAGQNYPPPSGN